MDKTFYLAMKMAVTESKQHGFKTTQKNYIFQEIN